MSEEQINQEGSVNHQVADYINKAWACYTIIDQERQLKEPTSKMQLNDSITWLQKAKDLNPKDEQSLQWIKELEDWIRVWKKRHFDGSKMVIIGTVVVSLIVALPGLALISAAFHGEPVGDAIISLGKIIAWFIGGAFAYYFTSRAPRWLVDRRNSKFRLGKASSKFGWGMITSLINSDFSYRVRYKDGKTEVKQNMVGSSIAFILMITYFGFNVGIIPVRALINFLRNYVFYK
ncbi:MAG: hypothetical protein KAU06_00050 [Candidatus Marinimicrobia bacterium]|nr:hypothetical protein [Candidatus Neomarinimicrobiota bacterium]